ncbi:C-Jun-amino-terminal kinase-interacting protein 1-like [Acropora millepora]|uniref:C-Jun-amino-terminal kinase-interacting protein 1-like n=1 Tax=Acropora millepora TaxID=45264 RepID=UPI001CF0D987|nr:C-Jun-amino-terminal kinase-interacting protein 1-like [Acropora millepora]
MLNSAASSLVIDGTSKREVIGQSLAAEYGVIEGKAESLKDQLQSIDADVYMRRPLNGKILMAEEAAHENERVSPVEASPHERKLSNSGTERNKRILPKTPKSLYSSTSQPEAKNNNQSTDKQSRRTSDTKCLNPSGVSSSSGDMSPVSPETDETEDRFFNTKPKQTHIALYKFVARHDDETGLDPGDAVYVGKKCEDLWFEGVNLRTGKAGIFPSRYVSDILQDPSIQDNPNGMQATQFSLRFLGSVEVSSFKGNEIICSAMKEIVKQHQMSSTAKPPACILDVTERGIRITEHPLGKGKGSSGSKKSSKNKLGKLFERDSKEKPNCHYFALKNVTFCGCHPHNARFFAFITKHPEDHRFACHVFMSEFSTEAVATAVGLAFKKFYSDFLDYQAPVEDFYIE